MTIYKKLAAARIGLQAAPMNKSGHNAFAKYNYFELGDFLPQINAIFNDVGLTGVISFTSEIATLKIFEHDGEGVITITSPMASAQLKGCHEIQSLGAVMTYQRRYLWQSALEIVEHDALDSTTGKEEIIDYKFLLNAVTSRDELNSVWKKVPDNQKKSLTTLAKEIGLKYPKEEEKPIKPEAKQRKSIADSSVDHATQAYEDNEARVYS